MENLNNEIGNEIETFTIKVDSELSEAELLELADEIVAYDKKIQVCEADLDELKKQVSELKKNIAEMENIRRMMMLDYERKRKSLNYTCTKNINYDNGTVEYVDIYSCEIVRTDRLDDNDLFAKYAENKKNNMNDEFLVSAIENALNNADNNNISNN